MTQTAVVIDALEQQVGCYRRLVKLAEIQHEHVQRDQTDGLMEVLTSRMSLVDQIGEIERQIAHVKSDWNRFLNATDADDRKRAESLLAERRELLAKITAADCNDVLVLQQRKLNVGRQIQQATAARKVNRTYGAAAYGNGNSNSSRMDVQR